MIKYESVTVMGTVLYCDRCKEKGPYEAYENVEDVTEAAERKGWCLDNDRHLCPTCTAVLKETEAS